MLYFITKSNNVIISKMKKKFIFSIFIMLITGIFLFGCLPVIKATKIKNKNIPGADPPKTGHIKINPEGIHKIKHIIIIIQENRSFDSYFGTFPGEDGIAMKNGISTISIFDPLTGEYMHPYPDHYDSNMGGPHGPDAFITDMDNGKMNGFIKEGEQASLMEKIWRKFLTFFRKRNISTDVMGYHTDSDIPNYWTYAKNFVLLDHLFEPIHAGSFPSHLFLMSLWCASSNTPDNPMSFKSTLHPIYRTKKNPEPFGWTDLTYLLHKNHVSWRCYLDGFSVPLVWNVLPGFVDVHQDHQIKNLVDISHYFNSAKKGTLPSVCWIVPSPADSEHPPALVSVGQSYVTRIINAAMKSPDWKSTAIFLTWDDWGGFYDNVVPPEVDKLGYGFRVPGLIISPYTKKGYIDHQILSFDAYAKFIEDDFCHGERLNPKTDGRPDSRPVVREDIPILGNLKKDFNFSQKPRRPLVLPVHPKTTLIKTWYDWIYEI